MCIEEGFIDFVRVFRHKLMDNGPSPRARVAKLVELLKKREPIEGIAPQLRCRRMVRKPLC